MEKVNTKPVIIQVMTGKTAWIFDVDGVITDPEKKEVTNPQLFDQLIKRLKKGEPVALATGRALEWVIEKVVDPLESIIKSNNDEISLLDNFYVSGEFGGSYLVYNNGKRKTFVNQDIFVPKEILQEASRIVQKEFFDSMFVDPDKKTHFTAEMKNGLKIKDFEQRQKTLLPLLQTVLDQEDREHELELHADLIATNIKNRKANKSFATTHILEWIKSKGIKPQNYIVFGDAISDLEIPEEIYKQSTPVKFIYVGKNTLTKKYPFVIKTPRNTYTEGTLEYLKSL